MFKSKERIGFVVVAFISKSPGDSAIYCRNARVLEMQKFHPGLHKWVDVRTDDFLRIKISWMHRLPNFLTHGAPLRYEERFFLLLLFTDI